MIPKRSTDSSVSHQILSSDGSATPPAIGAGPPCSLPGSAANPTHFSTCPFDHPRLRCPARVAIAIDLSDESAYAVRWAVQNYLRPRDSVVLLHVRPTSVLYGADWGSIKLQINPNSTNNHESATAISDEHPDEESQQKLENDFDIFTATKANTLAQPLVDAQVPFKIHIVKDHDMKERLCLEVERLGLSAEEDNGVTKKSIVGEDVKLQPVPEEEPVYHDAEEGHTDACYDSEATTKAFLFSKG
ncbi:Adenine nucleotide alpha hydrolases-like superfamily protein isoform 3 [Hibiscus syriacus]|uniref:Adenine nucleotide alpha hydrolases-like superfamily protein isoform 3 n=1 Tax=Hibiscus syriacus TaxID=106335 RepID=A0A6A2XLM5_HIBSY|nr:Adenine nucleotide alpha hydrolases-like superfamily protein isoform 3 [Hibiscus syriacus]